MSLPAPQPPQLSPENLRELQAARRSLGKIRRAVSTARFEGYSIAICGALTVLMNTDSIGYMLVGTVLTAIGIVEIVAAGRLRRLEVGAVRMLAINQLSLAALILLYALWNLHAEIAHPVSDFPDLSPSDAKLLGQMDSSVLGITHEAMLLLYGSLIAAAAVEAGMAWYYHSRAGHLREYLARTPPWIIAMQKAGISV
ncbi:MAG: hypothetical protein ABSD28_05935 [Tepidisphaeraceae bacterium]|jgi:uncharacterized membrane protein HdeD (DUF308 family)